MSPLTISEQLFEQLCARSKIECARIPEQHGVRTADYRVNVPQVPLIVEIKQLDPTNEDKRLEAVWGTRESPGAIAPSDRVQAQLDAGYPQIKRSAEGQWPAMIVVYNNSGPWNWIDSFTVAKAMFGSFGIVLGLQPDQTISAVGQGYLGQRRVTKSTYRALSVVGVLKCASADRLTLDCYHNPFATVRADPQSLSKLAHTQYIHPNPHDRGFIPWEPTRIQT